MELLAVTPSPSDLPRVLDALASWQFDGLPVQLHPGDLGWHWRFGADEVARALRVWQRDGRPVAVAFVDADVARFGIAPEVADDHDVAADLLRSLGDPSVLPASATVEARFGAAFGSLLRDAGWGDDEAWSPLRLDLARPLDPPRLEIEVVGPALAAERAAVHRAAFPGSSFTSERWLAMSKGDPYRSARCLIGRDTRGAAVAAATVWSAGAGRPGLVEPLGVHPGHRVHGHGREITRAAAAALRELGASSAAVATPSANRAAVAAYESAGFVADDAVTDFRRPA